MAGDNANQSRGDAPAVTRMTGQIPTLLRGFAFLAIFIWMIGAPSYRQLAGGHTSHTRSWTMFSGWGLGAIDARFYLRAEDGTLIELDRWEATGRQVPKKIPDRRIRDRQALNEEIKRLCQALGPEADLRVSARQAARRRGWIWIHQGERNVCANERHEER